MKRKFTFDKKQFTTDTKKVGKIDIEIALTEKGDQKVFSATANIWNASNTLVFCGGQCLDEITDYLAGNELFDELSRLWACYHLNDMHAECEHQRELGWCDIAKTKVKYGNNTKYLGWLYESEHADGILSKPCPVCGYKYGTSWNYVPIPSDDENIIIKLIENGEL